MNRKDLFRKVTKIEARPRPLRITIPRTPGESATSEPEGTAEAVGSKPDIGAGESEAGRGPAVQRTWPERALSAIFGHSPSCASVPALPMQ